MKSHLPKSCALTMLAAFCAVACAAPPAIAQQWSPQWDEPWDGPRAPRGFDRYGDPGGQRDDRYDDRGYDDRGNDEEIQPPPRFGRRGDDRFDRYDRDNGDRDDGEFAPPSRGRDVDEPSDNYEQQDATSNRTPGVSGGPRPYIAPAAPPKTFFSGAYRPGSVVIDTSARKLYYVLSPTVAYAYPIGVGREGFRWTGKQKVSRITDWPDWHPPAEMRKRKPELPERMSGGVNNPLGAKAIYLGSTLYRIHGTNDPNSIGRAESSGCFRMMNAHVLHLASLVQVGTEVAVVRSLAGAAVASAQKQPETQPDTRSERPIRQRAPRWYEDDYDPDWRY